MVEFTASAMKNLVELLRPPEPEVLQGEDLASSPYEITSTRDKIPPESTEKKAPRTIEEYEEQEAKESEEAGKVGAGIDDRKVPEYSMNYQQAVSAEDVFLQIGPKTPGSASCENLIVRIKMPGDKKENVDLAVDTNSVTVNSSQYSLKLPLPHGINPDLSKANWDSADETLVLTLKLDREFDFVNF
ncbi:dynein axonemal assembly factor 6 [Pectinophora gossypiella]|uniref:dynein axonemal assembly factor 6 n=1 Tax=Pectinophora gossypiella TaxID=13191 RepID=UPI00214EF4A2|nr:dynein axonemal assembly factor 6 [Pectinophora gossypiella]